MTLGSLPKFLRIRFFSVNEYAICVPRLLIHHSKATSLHASVLYLQGLSMAAFPAQDENAPVETGGCGNASGRREQPLVRNDKRLAAENSCQPASSHLAGKTGA